MIPNAFDGMSSYLRHLQAWKCVQTWRPTEQIRPMQAVAFPGGKLSLCFLCRQQFLY